MPLDGRSLCVALDLSSLQPASLTSPPSLPGPVELPAPRLASGPQALAPLPAPSLGPSPGPAPGEPLLLPSRARAAPSVAPPASLATPPGPPAIGAIPAGVPLGQAAAAATKPGKWNVRASLKALMVSTIIHFRTAKSAFAHSMAMVFSGSACAAAGGATGAPNLPHVGSATAPGCAAGPGAGGGPPTLPHVGQACGTGSRRPARPPSGASCCLGASCCGQGTGAPGTNRGGR